MRTFGSRALVIGLGAIAFVACGGSRAAPPSADAACTAYFDAVCTQLEACSPVFPLLDGDHDTCVARRSADCKKNYLGPGSKETATELEACLRALAPASCDDIYALFFENFELPSECAILNGDGAAGSPCAAPDQCASAVCVEQAGYVEDDDPCGHCGSGHPTGGTCNTSSDCARGLACAHGTCAPYGNRGKACDEFHPCHASLQCSATCVPRDTGTQLCTTSSTCALDLECNTVRSKCVAPVATGGVEGASCGVTRGGDYAACARGFICNTAGASANTDGGADGGANGGADGAGRCLAFANAGESCIDHPCALPLRCIHATCQLQDAATCH